MIQSREEEGTIQLQGLMAAKWEHNLFLHHIDRDFGQSTDPSIELRFKLSHPGPVVSSSTIDFVLVLPFFSKRRKQLIFQQGIYRRMDLLQ